MQAVATRKKTATLEHSPIEFEQEIERLQKILEANEKELARVAAVNLGNKGPALRNLLDQIYSLDIDATLKRKMTDACMHIIEMETFAKRNNTELTETDAAFIAKVGKKHHGLNQRELKICLFIKLNYDSEEIARSNGISTRGMESIRYRMHKKLGIGRHDSIKSYLCDLALTP